MANSLDEKIQAGGKRKAALASATNEDVQSKKLKNAAGQGITPEQARSIAPIAPMAPMHAPIHGYVGHRSSIGDGFDLSAENLGDEIFNAIEKHKAEATPTPFEVRRGRSAHHRRTPAVSEPMTGVETEQDAFVQAVHNARGRDDGEADDEGDGGTDPEHEEKIREKKSKSREVSAALEEDEDMPDVDEESAFLSGGGPNAEGQLGPQEVDYIF